MIKSYICIKQKKQMNTDEIRVGSNPFIKRPWNVILDRSREQLNEFLSSFLDKNIYLWSYLELYRSDYSATCVAYRNTFGITVNDKSIIIIGINNRFCTSLRLSDEELAAIILHEFGHLSSKDEFIADELPVKLGFGDELKALLEKSLTIESLSELHEEFNRRISAISHCPL